MPRAGRLLGWWTLVLGLGVAGCGDGGSDTTGTTTTTSVELPPPMDPLPPVESTATDRFATSRTCYQCHLAGDSPLMHDANGDDISPAFLWRSSMMAFAAKDPYYLAVWSEARHSHKSVAPTIDAACGRCHAPAGSVASDLSLSFEELTTGATDPAHLGRDSVTCTLCHQIQADNLGEVASFSGGFEVGFDREMFGPHEAPVTSPMKMFVSYTPTHAPHLATSEVCATCHTVVVPFLDASGEPTGEGFLEQAPYFEWLNSTYAPDTPCGTCHLPLSDVDGSPLSSPIAKYPDGLDSREPFGQHTFEGGNAYMLSILADNVEWTGSDVPPEELERAAQRGALHLETAAELEIVSAAPNGANFEVVVEIRNKTGHKLPTGYPSRRMWLHVRAEDASGSALFESGAPGDLGEIESEGARVDAADTLLPHLDVVAPGQVQVYEAIAVTAEGAPTHKPLEQAYLGKDNRLLPVGWAEDGPMAEWTVPVGTSGDKTFVPGKDRVTYRIPDPGAVARVKVVLLYQTLPRATAEALAVTPTPAAVAFSTMVSARPPTPVVMAEATWE